MHALAVAALLALASLAGCAGLGGERCDPPFPLDVQAYPMVTDPSRYQVQTTLWNCTGEPIPLDDPCEARDGLMPSILIDGVPYFLSFVSNGSASRREDVRCFEHPHPVAAVPVAEPGAYLEQRYAWDGTYRPDGGAPVPVPPGAYVVSARAGRHYDSAVIDAPFAQSSFS